jgi:hypothetical protein
MRSIQSSRSRTAIAATSGTAIRTPTKPKRIPIISSANITTAGWRETARLITSGCIRYDSIVWIAA